MRQLTTQEANHILAALNLGQRIATTRESWEREEMGKYFRDSEPLTYRQVEDLIQDFQRGDEPYDKEYRSAAERNYSSEDIQVDSNAIVSQGADDPGAFVAAWVWVTNEEAGIKEEGEV